MYKRNNMRNKYLTYYNGCLSAFGQKVLSNLIDFQTERNRKLRPYAEETPIGRQTQPQTQVHKKRIITFNDGCDTQQQIHEYQHNTIKTISPIIEKCTDVVPIPTNMELIEPAVGVAISETSSIPLTTSNVLSDNLININEKTNEVDNTNTVGWNNCIDTDLLSEFNINSNAYSITDIANNNAPLFKLHFTKDKARTNINSENEQNVKEKRTKRKTAVKNCDTNKKTIVESDVALDKKPNFRKKKYTTAVKDWLKDIDCGNVDDLDRGFDQNIVMNTHDDGIENVTKEITIEEVPKNNKKKKTIQAQLANKDGIMKYSKPRNKTNEKVVEDNISTIISDKNEIEKDRDVIIDKPVNVNVTKTPKKCKDDKFKEKNIKAKFIAPIKSQIPVKDITYDITIVNKNNLDDCSIHFNTIESQEVVVTVLYDNGFSQLNSHHTDDSYTAEGLMFLINNNFYYFKGNDIGFINFINEIMKMKIVSYDAKHVLIYVISSFDIPIGKLNLNIFDTKIGASLIEPDNTPENFSDLQKLLNFKAEYTIATDCNLQKCAWYMTSLAQCAETLQIELVERELWKLFVDVEMPVLSVIAEMEHRGVCVDLEKLKSMEGILLKQMKTTELECHKAAGKSFQVNSAVQVRAILYDELKLDTQCNVKIRETICKGAKSTSETMLRSLMSVHPLPRLILEYRHLHKAHATFLAGIVPHVRNGIIRPTWIQTAAATGRIACSNPNLQAIPKTPFSLVLFPQEKDSDIETDTLKFRSVYTARSGCTLLAADFKHVECRVFAHQAADTGLLAALASPDLFRELAAKWLNKSPESVVAEERERTKRIVYASLYGAGSRKLMEILDVSYDHALSIVSSFNRTFPAMKTFGRWVVSQCEQNNGRIRTASGRTRTFPNINSKDFAIKSHAERQAINFVVQGLAADITKLAMCRTARVVGAPLLQIHDELVWELPHQHVATAAAIIKSTMEECGREFGISVPLPVALYHGPSWGDLTEFTLDDINHK